MCGWLTFDDSKGRSSSTEGLSATEGTEIARLDRGADASDGGEPGVVGAVCDSEHSRVRLRVEDSNLQKHK